MVPTCTNHLRTLTIRTSGTGSRAPNEYTTATCGSDINTTHIHHHHRQDQNHWHHTSKHRTHCTVRIIIRWMLLCISKAWPAPSWKHTTTLATKRMGCDNTSVYHRSNRWISAFRCWLPQLDTHTRQRRNNHIRRRSGWRSQRLHDIIQIRAGGVIAGLEAIIMLHRSGLVCLRHIKFMCDNSATIIAAKRTVTQSIFHRLKSDYDLISTMKFLQGNWCKDYEITYEWAKGYADRQMRIRTRKRDWT
jgi:hypothetical protein